MWARWIEAWLGFWLLVSPAVFGHGSPGAWADRLAGACAILLAALSARRATRHGHFLTVIVAAGLIAFAWAAFPRPSPPYAQNEILVGLLLGLFAVVPDHASAAPSGWRRHVRPPARAAEPQ